MENTLENYMINATRTESLVDNIDERNSRVIHALMGLVTESGELIDALKRHYFYVKADKTRKPLDVVNLREECGDLMWYLAVLCDHYEKNFAETYYKCLHMENVPKEVSDSRFLRRAMRMNITAGKMLDNFITMNEEPNIEEIFHNINYLVYELGGDWRDITKSNIEKLKARFPNAYNIDDALNRDLNTEREILEK